MKLRKKTLIIIGATIISLIAILSATSQIILLNSFVELEEHNVNQNAERALSALDDMADNLDTVTFDWAAWDDTYAFIEDLNDDYIQSNLLDPTFIGLRLNIMLFINSSGQTVFGKGFDLHNEEEMPVPQSLQEHLDNGLLLRHPDTDSRVTGIILLPEGTMLIASRPILTSEEEGPIRGTLIMGRYLDSAEIERLAETTHLSLTARRFNDPQMPPDFQAASSYLSKEAPTFIQPLSGEAIAGYAMLEDIYGKPSLVLRVDMPRDIYEQGRSSFSYFILSLVVVGLVFGVVTMLLLENVVLSRLARLSSSVSSIGRSGVLSARVSMTGRDELSSLAGDINKMLAELEQTTRELQKSERTVTTGEVAGMVGHDLRNPLQVIVNIVHLAKERLRSMSSPPAEKRGVEELFQTITEQAEYMNKIVSDLQDYAKPMKPELVETSLHKLITDTLSTITVPETVKVSTVIEKDFPKLMVDPSLMRRVITNLVINALQAMPNGGQLTIGASKTEETASISIQDTGAGIPKENMDKLFQPLFTTKSKGTGLGLAVCKRLVEAHDGSITVESKVGRGSTFTIKIPFRRGVS
ncbi:MAG: CHASE4 domain-containing protein [Candidatus Bathyarchaeia archaeon]